LEFMKAMLEATGVNPDEVFRRRDFHEVRLKLKADDTPAKITIHHPYNPTEQGLDANQPLRFYVEIEDQESWFKTEDVAVWITDEFGTPVWDPLTVSAPVEGADPRDKWTVTPQLGANDKFRFEKTKMMPRAFIEVPGARHEGPGIYYACVQVMNGAQVVSGSRNMFFVGDAKPWTVISDVRPFLAVYKQGDELRIQHTFFNIKDTPIKSVQLSLKKPPAILTVISAEDGKYD